MALLDIAEATINMSIVTALVNQKSIDVSLMETGVLYHVCYRSAMRHPFLDALMGMLCASSVVDVTYVGIAQCLMFVCLLL
ncbi:hypothetical protein DPMN_181077 [Dreissena polymorpha]|uniref:Uncharacterized protein n=1 Tax=Dreissena polymorpha TaxID=45954 RepID=A0A9D4I4Z2_DREPO|nr:hypothetical protein DPMN_181077 [Dreissena polymorpha]